MKEAKNSPRRARSVAAAPFFLWGDSRALREAALRPRRVAKNLFRGRRAALASPQAFSRERQLRLRASFRANAAAGVILLRAALFPVACFSLLCKGRFFFPARSGEGAWARRALGFALGFKRAALEAAVKVFARESAAPYAHPRRDEPNFAAPRPTPPRPAPPYRAPPYSCAPLPSPPCSAEPTVSLRSPAYPHVPLRAHTQSSYPTYP